MRRNPSRSHYLFAGLLFLSLTFFFIPEAHVHALRGRVLSAMGPILGFFSGFSRPQGPREASIQIEVQQPTGAEYEPITLPQTPAEEVDALRRANVQLDNEVKRLTALLPPQGEEPAESLNGVAARVIARQILWQEPLYGLNRGEADGVKLNAGVVFRGMAVGRIVAAGPRASSMALVTHRGVSISARLTDCRVEGLVQGLKDDGGERLCRMAIVTRELHAKVGERVVTSGFDGAFPPNVWLGVVVDVKKVGDVQWEVTVRPACDERVIEVVTVLTQGLPEVPWPVMPAPKKK